MSGNPLPTEKFHYFDLLDSLISFDTSLIIEDELEKNIFSNFINYNIGLPGSGIHIWHIKEPNQADIDSGVNSDPNNRHVQIEEADGAVDIGFESYTFFASQAVNIGWRYDYWFSENTAYLTDGNPNSGKVIFDNESNPTTRTTDGAESFLSLTMLDDTLYTTNGDTIFTPISDYMNINIQFNFGKSDTKIEIVNLSNEPVQYMGNSVQDSIGYIFYAKDDSIYRHSYINGKEFIEIFNPLLGEFVFTYDDSIYITNNKY